MYKSVKHSLQHIFMTPVMLLALIALSSMLVVGLVSLRVSAQEPCEQPQSLIESLNNDCADEPEATDKNSADENETPEEHSTLETQSERTTPEATSGTETNEATEEQPSDQPEQSPLEKLLNQIEAESTEPETAPAPTTPVANPAPAPQQQPVDADSLPKTGPAQDFVALVAVTSILYFGKNYFASRKLFNV